MKQPIRILQIVPNMQSGGLENLIMNIYRNIDREKVQFDFLVHYKEEKHFDKEIEQLGGHIYRFDLRNNNNIFKYITNLNKFYREHKEYKVIHCHMSSIGFINFLIAKKNKIDVRIAHSHNSSTDKTLKGKIKKIMMIPYKYVSTLNFACSTESGEFLFKKKKFEFFPNAIDVEKYKFSNKSRLFYREKLNISDDEIVIGHIGRFNIQKNHDFIIKLFKSLIDNGYKYKLLLIGSGELKSNIEEKCKKMKIADKVVFTGEIKNSYEYYNVMDLFILPSLFEGLPVVGVEAQANGLHCIFSNNITKEVEVTNLISYVNLDVEEWMEKIKNIDIEKSLSDRNKQFDKVLKSKFNIKKLSLNMQNRYIELYYKEKM